MLHLSATNSSLVGRQSTVGIGEYNVSVNNGHRTRSRFQSLTDALLEGIGGARDRHAGENTRRLSQNHKSDPQLLANCSLVIERRGNVTPSGLLSALSPNAWLQQNLHLPSPHKRSPRVCLNVGGTHFEIARALLLRFPTTRLGRLGRLLERERTPTEEELLAICDDYRLASADRLPETSETVDEEVPATNVSFEKPLASSVDDFGEENPTHDEGLTSAEQLCATPAPVSNAHLSWFYFERDSTIVPMLLNLFRTGKLHLGDEMCIINFAEELAYWEVDTVRLVNSASTWTIDYSTARWCLKYWTVQYTVV